LLSSFFRARLLANGGARKTGSKRPAGFRQNGVVGCSSEIGEV